MSTGWAWTVLALVFVDEVLAVVALGFAGFVLGGWPWALLLAVVAIGTWWTFASPKAPLGGPVVRPVAKVLVFGAACAGLWWAGNQALSVALLAFSLLVNGLAQTRGVRAVVDSLAAEGS